MKYVLVGTMYGLIKGLYELLKKIKKTNNIFVSTVLCFILMIVSIVGLSILLVESIVVFVLMFLLGQRLCLEKCKLYKGVGETIANIHDIVFGQDEEEEQILEDVLELEEI